MALLAKASRLLSDQDLEGAKTTAELALKLDPTNGEVHLTLASVYRVQENWREAIREYRIYQRYLKKQDLPPSEDGPEEYFRRMIEDMEKQLKAEEN